MHGRSRVARGFTLIELMVVVAIIGLLSSVAIPSFQNMRFRSKQTERTVLMIGIQRSIDDYWIRDNHYPLVSGTTTWMYLLNWNPDATPGTQKRPWRLVKQNALDHWGNLSMMVEGAVYYSYYGYAYEYPQYRVTYLKAAGDLDGDKIQDVLERYWEYQGSKLVKYPEYPCADCSIQIRTPASGLAF